MKTILFPTDFSQQAQNALNYTIHLAKAFNSTIHLLHTYQVHSSADMLVSIDRYIIEDAENMMQESIDWIHEKWPEHPEVEYNIIKGSSIPVIGRMANRFDLVVMGTQGASKVENVFLGSTTNGVCKYTKTPVLAIPTMAQYKPLKNIVLAVDDFEVTDKQVLASLVSLAKKFKSKIKIFHSDRGQVDLGVDPIIGMYLAGTDYSFHYAESPIRVNKAIHDFIKAEGADLLCMIGRKRAKINEIFHRSVTRREVLQTEIPLLILTDLAIVTDY